MTDSAFIEREAELARLQEFVLAAARGQGRAASIVGPAGIGKTSLLAAAQEMAAHAGMTVLSARGGELEQSFAYGVVRQLLEGPLRALESSEREATLDGARAAAPVLGFATVSDEPPEAVTFAVLNGLYWVCSNLAARGGPLLMVVDDLQWADGASVRFVGYLQRRLDELPAFVLTAARRADWDLLEQVTDDPLAAALRPAPLTHAGVRSLLGPDADEQFAAACHVATAGNPFLCRTLAAAFAAQGVAPDASAAGRVTEIATDAVAEDVLRRMGRVSVPGVGLTRAVAVLGNDAALRHAASLAGLDEPQAASLAGALVEQGLLRGGAALDFVHPLLRDAVVAGIPDPERALLHRRAARLLGDDGMAPERIAIHLLPATTSGDPWAVEVLRNAASSATAQGDPPAARRLLRRALDEPPEAGVRALVLHDLGVAELQCGADAEAERYLRDALELARDDLPLRTETARDLALCLRTRHRYEESVAVMESAIAEVAAHDRDRAMALEAELHQGAMMHAATYRAVGDRFPDLDREVQGASRGERGFLAALATESCMRIDSAERVRSWARLALERGLVEDDDAHSGLWANVGFPLVFAEGFDLAADLCAAAIARGRRVGSPIGLARAHLVSAMLSLRLGALREAAVDARISIDAGRNGGFHPWLMAVGVLLEVLVERGELDAAEALLRESGVERGVPDRFVGLWVILGRASVRVAQGRLDEGIADLEQLGHRGEDSWRPWNPAMFPYRSALALALLPTGDVQRAEALAIEELEFARRWGAPRAIGVAQRTLGVVTRNVEHLETAVRTLAGSGAALEHGRALVELGSEIARSGRKREAREPLHAGMDIAARCGATALVARARGELVAAGARPRRIMRTGVDALTPSELRVARMAADGMTNRQIAQALFVTLRTVEVHLTHAYQKLDIASREALRAALGE